MRNLAYWTTLVVVALSLVMFIYACGTINKSCPSELAMEDRSTTGTPVHFTSANREATSSVAPGKVTSYAKSRVFRVLAPDTSFVVRGQLLYILDDTDIWNKILLTNERLRREMQMAEKFIAAPDEAGEAWVGYMSSRRKIQELNHLRNQLYKELSKTRIRAPFTGMLGISRVKPGDEVYPGLLLNDITTYENDQLQQRAELAGGEKRGDTR